MSLDQSVGSPIYIIKPDNIIFFKIWTRLHLDQFQGDFARVFHSVSFRGQACVIVVIGGGKV
jgi:hypothetical protein